ncbi:MAG: MarR family transcriptional regulator [Candidatus Omnitrophica bacterium]|nr:MarR family transcriptional regulator [Candidatus Omnitrophota bacterium]
MSQLTLSEFVDKLSEMMPAIMREFLKQESDKFYNVKITIPQLVVLEMLTRDGESRMTDLARSINVTTAAMTGIVDRLVRDGYVTRTSDLEDRRVIKIKPTAKGARVAKSALEHKKAIFRKMFGVISQDDREEYLRILTIIRDRIGTPGAVTT